MKVTITIKGEDSPEERTMTVYSLASLDGIERLINQAITKESTDRGWVVVKKPEASGPTGPSNIIMDEMGQWDHTRIVNSGELYWNMNFSKEETKALLGKGVKKLNNGDQID